MLSSAVLAESRMGAYTQEQLHQKSTLVIRGVVQETETLTDYNLRFPTKASVVAVLKGSWDKKDISFKHKHPGRNIILEQEYNPPEIGQSGTFYLEDQNGTLILIGYIKETEQGGPGYPPQGVGSPDP